MKILFYVLFYSSVLVIIHCITLAGDNPKVKTRADEYPLLSREIVPINMVRNGEHVYLVHSTWEETDFIYGERKLHISKYLLREDKQLMPIWMRHFVEGDSSWSIFLTNHYNIIEPNDIGGVDINAVFFPIYYQFLKHYSFDGDGQLVYENIDRYIDTIDTFPKCDICPPRYASACGLVKNSENKMFQIFQDFNPKDETPYFKQLVAVIYDSIANIIEKRRLLSLGFDEDILINNEFPIFDDSLVSISNVYMSNMRAHFNHSGELFVTLDCSVIFDSTTKRVVLLTKFDSKLNYLWTKVPFVNSKSLLISDFEIDDDNNIILVGEDLNRETWYKYQRLMKMDGSTGDILSYSDTWGDYNKVHIHDLIVTADSSFLVLGSFEKDIEGEDFRVTRYYAAKFDADFNMLWEVVDNEPFIDNEFRYYFVGALEVEPNYYLAYAEKQTYDGYAGGSLIVSIDDTKPSSIIVKANSDCEIRLVSDEILIDVTSENFIKISITICDVMGRIVYSQEISSASNISERINCYKFNRGAYLINVRTNSTSISKKLLIE